MRILLAYFSQFVNRSGGMEHVCCEFANAMTARGHHVDIAYASLLDGTPFYPVAEEVNLYNLFQLWPERPIEPGKYLSFSQKILRELIRLIDRDSIPEWNQNHKNIRYHQLFKQLCTRISFDIIVSFEPRTTASILYKEKNFIPIVTMIHFNPDAVLHQATYAEKESINKSDVIQVLLPSYKEYLHAIFPNAHIICIQNIVPQYKTQNNLMKKKKIYTVINVARLNKEQKQQHMLIQAFSRVAPIFSIGD